MRYILINLSYKIVSLTDCFFPPMKFQVCVFWLEALLILLATNKKKHLRLLCTIDIFLLLFRFHGNNNTKTFLFVVYLSKQKHNHMFYN